MEDWSSFYNLFGQIKVKAKKVRNTFKSTNKIMTCVKEIEGFTLGKEYRLIGSSGEYIQLKDDYGDEVILFDSYFI